MKRISLKREALEEMGGRHFELRELPRAKQLELAGQFDRATSPELKTDDDAWEQLCVLARMLLHPVDGGGAPTQEWLDNNASGGLIVGWFDATIELMEFKDVLGNLERRQQAAMAPKTSS